MYLRKVSTQVCGDTYQKCTSMCTFVWEAPLGLHTQRQMDVDMCHSYPAILCSISQPATRPHPGARHAWAVLVAWERRRSVVAESADCPVESGLCPSLTVHSWASYINSPCLSFVVCKQGSRQHFIRYKARKMVPGTSEGQTKVNY